MEQNILDRDFNIVHSNRDMENDWDDYVRNHSEGSIYHISAWLSILEKKRVRNV